MTPQMKQILEQFDNLSLCYPDIESDDTEQYYAGQAHMKQHMREFVMQSCIEYARSIMPQEADIDTLGSAVARMNQVGWNECRIAMLNSIEQDSLDLPTN